MNYYNEFDKGAAQWLRNLIAAELIPLVRSTSVLLPRYSRAMFLDSHSVTFLPESEDGHSHCNSPAGQQIVPSGQAVVPVSHSVMPEHPGEQPASAAPMTAGICGPNSSDSLSSESLQKYLENRLHQRLAGSGSPLYVLIWKQRVMQSGVPVCRLQPSARRTKGNVFSGLPTPAASDHKGSPSLQRVNERAALSSRGVRLPEHMSKILQIEVGTNMNPDLPRWLMGYPPEWLQSLRKDLATP